MEIKTLIDKWQLFTGDASGSLKSLRIDSSAIPDLFIGLDKEQRRCLILQLPADYTPDFQSSVKQNLSLELYTASRWIVLSLLDEQYFDLFNDLIFSIYYKIKDIPDPVSYVSELLKIYYKWSEFFTDGLSDGLSDDIIKGLFGELIVLNELLKETNSSTLNDVLNSWKGPYDTGHDFIGETLDLEVKTKNVTTSNVKISSEYQLESDPGKELELIIVNVNLDPVNGISLKDIVQFIRSYVTERLGDYTILLKALAKKGLTHKNLNEYDHLRFLRVGLTKYQCSEENFPKLVRSSLPNPINSLSYLLNVDQLKAFIKSEISF